jgi:hypothetical protein
MQKKKLFLIAGDLLAIALVTAIGFATHGEAGVAFLPRMAAIFLPLSLAWFVLAPSLGLFHQETVASPGQVVAARAGNGLCRAAGSHPAWTDPQRAHHPDLWPGAIGHVRVWDAGVENGLVEMGSEAVM